MWIGRSGMRRGVQPLSRSSQGVFVYILCVQASVVVCVQYGRCARGGECFFVTFVEMCSVMFDCESSRPSSLRWPPRSVKHQLREFGTTGTRLACHVFPPTPMDEETLRSQLERTRGGNLLLRALSRSESTGDLTSAALSDTLAEDALSAQCELLALVCRAEYEAGLSRVQETVPASVTCQLRGAKRGQCAEETREEENMTSPGKRARQGLMGLSQRCPATS